MQQERKTSKKKVVLSEEEFIPKRFGLNFNPPMIILEYMLRSRGKLYLKKMKIFKLKPTTTSEVALKYLKMRYPDFFVTDKIKDRQLLILIDKLKEFLLRDQTMKKQRIETVLESSNLETITPDIPKNPDSGPSSSTIKRNNFIETPAPNNPSGPDIVRGKPTVINASRRNSTSRSINDVKDYDSGSSNEGDGETGGEREEGREEAGDKGEERPEEVIDDDFDFDEIEDFDDETDEK